MKKLIPYLIPLSLLVIALSIFSLGYESKMGGEPMMGATTKIKLTDPNSVTPAATSTPTANMIPIASSTGFLEGWSSVTSTINNVITGSGYEIVSSTCSWSSGSNSCSATANCSSGKRVVGGGYSLSGDRAHQQTSYPASSTAWSAYARDDAGGGSGTLRVYAICVKI